MGGIFCTVIGGLDMSETAGSFLVLPLYELGKRFLYCFIALAILDFGACYRTKARYFWLHGLWNMVITIVVIPDSLRCFLSPVGVLDGDGTHWPVVMVISLHIWHMIAYRGLTADDIFHHFAFAFSLGAMALGYSWGYIESFLVFFVCGLPGGLDYLWLGMLKAGWIRKIDEKRWNATNNTWCRAPGCVTAGIFIYADWMAGGGAHIPWPLKLCAALLCLTNGQYYGQRVVASWAVHELSQKKEKEAKESSSGIDQKNNPLEKAQRADGWQGFSFSPQTRKTVAESYNAREKT